MARFRDRDDDRAFTELVERHRGSVFRLALSILGPGFAGDAEEVAQEAFLRAHHSLGGFRGDAQFSSWLYRITFNLAVNLKERVRYRAPHLSDEALAGLSSLEPSPAERLHASERRQLVEGCVADLPEMYQSALRLHYWMGHSISEIAVLLAVPDNTVKSYLHRARGLLRVMLHERGVGDV